MEPTAIYATRQGNLNGEKIEMSVDAGSMAHVMSILTDLYSNKTRAVVREYSTNARDAMIEAGNGDKPIEVSLPNGLSPFFKVRDYGVGLSVEDIRNIYSKYGASTKRSTNEQVGMLGLGCKSALTYTQQFTVRSVKDGQLVLVAISRTESGSGVMEVVHTSDTDEQNGVEISVPVDRYNTFRQEAMDFFKYWEPGTVLVDGEQPASFTENAIKLADGLYLVEGASTDHIVMGNVAYRVSDENWLYKNSYYGSRGFGIVAIVPIGSVNFTPSREDLHYTRLTHQTISDLRKKTETFLISSIQEDIDSQETHIEARKVCERWSNVVRSNNHKFNYRGQSIPSYMQHPHHRYNVNYGRGSVDFYRDINFNQAERAIFIHGYETSSGVSTAHRAKIRLWASQNNYSNVQTFVLNKEEADKTWFTPVASVAWEEIFKTRVPRDKSAGDKTVYRIRTKDLRYDRNVDELPAHKRIILWSSGEKETAEYITQAIALCDGAIAVNLPKNRWAKFIRENKNVIEFDKFVSEMMEEKLSGLSDQDVIFVTLNYDERRALASLDSSRVDDPELAKKIDASKIVRSNAVNAYWDVYNMCHRMGYSVKTPDKQENALITYPLLRGSDGLALSIEHCYTYVNAVYNSNK